MDPRADQPYVQTPTLDDAAELSSVHLTAADSTASSIAVCGAASSPMVSVTWVRYAVHRTGGLPPARTPSGPSESTDCHRCSYGCPSAGQWNIPRL